MEWRLTSDWAVAVVVCLQTQWSVCGKDSDKKRASLNRRHARRTDECCRPRRSDGGKSTRSRASLFRPSVPTRLSAARRGGRKKGQAAGMQRSGRRGKPLLTKGSPGESKGRRKPFQSTLTTTAGRNHKMTQVGSTWRNDGGTRRAKYCGCDVMYPSPSDLTRCMRCIHLL